MVSNFIKLTDPPTDRQFVARASVALPAGTDPSTIYNDLRRPQQYHLFARTNAWDIYMWHVLAPAGTTLINLGDTYSPPKTKTLFVPGGGGGSVPGGTTPPRGGISIDATRISTEDWITPRRQLLLDPAFITATVVRPRNVAGAVSEDIRLSGALGTPDMAGDLRYRWRRHHNSVRYGGWHIVWDVRRGDPYIYLTINWHRGTVGPEFNFTKVSLFIGHGWQAAKVLPDGATAAGGEGGGHLVLQHSETENHYMPRMFQRGFRLILYNPATTPTPDVPFVDKTWGTSDWLQGGYGPAQLRIPPPSFWQGTNLGPGQMEGGVRADAQSNTQLLSGNLNGSPIWGSGQTGTNTGLPVALWPMIDTAYGGRGSEGEYAHYAGMRTASCGEPRGLLAHQIRLLYWASRQPVIYEPDGAPVIPENHLVNGARAWNFHDYGRFRCTNFPNPYGDWEDVGFGFSQYSAPQFPRAYLIESTKVVPATGEVLGAALTIRDPIDAQHNGRAWHDACALAWLDNDPLAVQYLVCYAEMFRMLFWGGANPSIQESGQLPNVGRGVIWGRAQGWHLFLMAWAAAFDTTTAVLPLTDASDSEGAPTALQLAGRKQRWAESELRWYVQGWEMARMPSGNALLSGPATKLDKGNPYRQQYKVMQSIEIAYWQIGLQAAAGVFGDTFWPSARFPGAQISINEQLGLVSKHWRDLGWATGTWPDPLEPVVIFDGGKDYTALDLIELQNEHYLNNGDYANSTNGAQDPRVLATYRVDAVDPGTGAITAVTHIDEGNGYGDYEYTNHPDPHGVEVTGWFGDPIDAPGSGYTVGDVLDVLSDGTVDPLKRPQVQVASVSASVSALSVATETRGARYLPGDTITILGVTGTAPVLTVLTTDVLGRVETFDLTTPGSVTNIGTPGAYATTTSGAGAGFTCGVEWSGLPNGVTGLVAAPVRAGSLNEVVIPAVVDTSGGTGSGCRLRMTDGSVAGLTWRANASGRCTSRVTAATLRPGEGGTGYRVNDELRFIEGALVHRNNDPSGSNRNVLRYKVLTISGGGATGPIATVQKLSGDGVYHIPPAAISTPWTNGAGSGANFDMTRRASGSRARIQVVKYAAPIKNRAGVWKVMPEARRFAGDFWETRAGVVPVSGDVTDPVYHRPTFDSYNGGEVGLNLVHDYNLGEFFGTAAGTAYPLVQELLLWGAALASPGPAPTNAVDALDEVRQRGRFIAGNQSPPVENFIMLLSAYYDLLAP